MTPDTKKFLELPNDILSEAYLILRPNQKNVAVNFHIEEMNDILCGNILSWFRAVPFESWVEFTHFLNRKYTAQKTDIRIVLKSFIEAGKLSDALSKKTNIEIAEFVIKFIWGKYDLNSPESELIDEVIKRLENI